MNAEQARSITFATLCYRQLDDIIKCVKKEANDGRYLLSLKIRNDQQVIDRVIEMLKEAGFNIESVRLQKDGTTDISINWRIK